MQRYEELSINKYQEDGTLSAISSTEYNHALATWAMELSYAAYNYPDGNELPSIPGAFMGDVDYTAADVLTDHWFGNIIEHNYTSADCGAHTIAYRDIEYIVEENTNNIEDGTEENDDISTFDCTSGTMDQGSLYDSVYHIGSDTGSNRTTVLLSETNTTNVTCGTVSTITVVTDKDAVKVQLVYHKSGSTFTLPRDHANVVSLVEDGDNLIYIST